MSIRMPSLFISHGAPSIAIEQDDFTRAVASFGKSLRGARAIAVVSAHWQSRNIRVPAVAREIATLLGASLEDERGWDHGLWVPLRILIPDANIPIVEIAQPYPTT